MDIFVGWEAEYVQYIYCLSKFYSVIFVIVWQIRNAIDFLSMPLTWKNTVDSIHFRYSGFNQIWNPGQFIRVQKVYVQKLSKCKRKYPVSWSFYPLLPFPSDNGRTHLGFVSFTVEN